MNTQVRTTSRRVRLRAARTVALAAVLVAPLALSACGNESATSGPAASSGNSRTGQPSTGATGGTTGGQGSQSPGSGPTFTCPPGAPVTGNPSTTPSGPMGPGGGHRMRTGVYFLHGEQMSPAPRQVTAPATAAGALRALLAGPNAYERGNGRTTAIPTGTALHSIVVRNHIATVDLSGRYDDGGGSLSMRARLAQVVFTATRFPGIQKVQFELDGKPVKTFGGEGIVLNSPVTRADFEDLSPAVLVESPMTGDSVRSPVRVWGSANTFEATFRLKITDVSGRRAAGVMVTATSGSGTRGTFDVTVPYKAARSGKGLLTAYYISPKDGRAVVVDTVPLTVNR
ncbi:GerMN domain-containing protein [Streptomyces sp. TRM66268-LWL]|uniref:GerMN domain-containing protein n=1 Tax=Streptomyces polyasparticus TaxID=2767826 RepID=A0ABR7SKU0_9ACTN|nr:Gmad2 immunoglobulin-like domain-containing protein [Streptomyces polyasparticus]MBC9715924.1 GerMN domain-containing protein [Streptomyces polyasparticus]